MYMYGKVYYSKERIYELNFGIDIPEIKKILVSETEESFTGDSDEIVIYLPKQIPKGYSFAKDKEVEEAVKYILLKFGIEEQFYPDFSQAYKWPGYIKNEGYDIIYILYFPETGRVYPVKQST